MKAAPVFALIALGWCLLIGTWYVYQTVNGGWDGFAVAAVPPVALASLGVVASYRWERLLWFSAVGLCLYVFAPGLLGLAFIPAAVIMVCAAIAHVLRAKPRGRAAA